MRRPLWLRLTGHYPHLMRDGLLTAFSGHLGLIGFTGLMFWFPAEEIRGIVLALERLSSTRHATVGQATVHCCSLSRHAPRRDLPRRRVGVGRRVEYEACRASTLGPMPSTSLCCESLGRVKASTMLDAST